MSGFWDCSKEPGVSMHPEIRIVRITEALGRYRSGELSCLEAAEVLGMSERHFRRLRERYEAEGAAGLVDRRLGRASARAAPVDQIAWVLDQYRTRYWDFTAKHFHEHLVRDHGFRLGYTWTKTRLQKAGLVKKAKQRGAHRKKRPRRPLPGMLLFQDGSPHRWLVDLGRDLDLIATMDDATGEVLSAFLVEEEGTLSSFRGLREVIQEKGLFCSFYTDRGSHYFLTSKAGGKVDKQRLTQVGRALSQLGIEHIASYSPEARGRIERLFGTLQKRLPQELRLAGITTIEQANRYIAETFLPAFNSQFMVPAAEQGSAFLAYVGRALGDILAIQQDRQVQNDNTLRYKGLVLQIPEQAHRRHFVKASVKILEYPDGNLAVFHGPRCLARYDQEGALLAGQSQQRVA
jgi:transposase